MLRGLPHLALVLLLGVCSCRRSSDSYPPPEQYRTTLQSELPMLRMGLPGYNAGVVGDVLDGGAGSRWTAQHPTFSFMLQPTENLDLWLDFSVHDRTFAETGPVTLTIMVNGEAIDQAKFDSPGRREYSHPVPSRVLRLKYPVEVRIDVDPVWIAPNDHQKLGILLFAVGFEEHPE